MMNFLRILQRVFPVPHESERMTVGERLLLLGLLLFGLGMFVYLSGALGPRYYWGNSSLFGHLNFYCPACGGTRALEHLINGRFLLAWQSNQLFILAIPLIAIGGFSLVRSVITGYPLTGSTINPYWLWGLLAITILFGVLRNIPLPALDFLRPPF